MQQLDDLVEVEEHSKLQSDKVCMGAAQELQPLIFTVTSPRQEERDEQVEPISEVRDGLDVDALDINDNDNEVSDVHGSDDA